MFLFGRKKSKINKSNGDLPRAVAFVDYEHWFISLEKIYGLRPDLQGWFDDLKTRCNIVEVIFFANFAKFTNKEVETRRIRSFTNKIIDTYNPDRHFVKDYTDFIILDNIYQKSLMDPTIDTFIIFSGDGHFSSAVAFLRNFCNKKVGIYGVQNCISKNLINNSDWCVELPFEHEQDDQYFKMIFSHLKDLSAEESIYPTFMKTIQMVSKINKVDSSKVKEALLQLIDEGYITQTHIKNQRNEELRVLIVDWKKVSKSKYGTN